MCCLAWVLAFAVWSGRAGVAHAPGQRSGTAAVPAAARQGGNLGGVAAREARVTARDAAYADEPVVVERLDTVYRYRGDGTGSKLMTEVARLQSEAGVRSLRVMSVPYLAATERLEVVYLRVRKGNGTVVDTPAADAQDEPAPVTQASPTYSSLHLLRVGVRGLAVGDRLEFQLRTVFTASAAKGEFWGVESFGRSEPVLERTVELRVPLGRDVKVSSPGRSAQKREEGTETVYRWTGAQLAGAGRAGTGEGGRGEGGRREAEEGGPAIAWTTFADWAAVGAWYRGLGGQGMTPTAAIRAKADAVIYGAATPEAKIRALYSYVSSQVRSINVPLGMGSYAPQPAGEVLANQYGDSQDKDVLLAAMLRAENLPASPVLVGAGVEVDEAVPSPGWFNRVITLTRDAEHGEVWLDTMPEIAPFGVLEGGLRGRLALVIPATGQAVLRRTPAGAPFAEFTRFEAAGTLSADGTLQAHVDLTLRGDEELRYRQGLRSAGQGQWDRVAQAYLRQNGLAGEPANVVADPPENTDAPLHLGFDYRREGYGDWESFRIPAPEPGMTLPMTERKTAPSEDIVFGGRRTDTAVSRITLPRGFGADLPLATHLQTGFATLDKTYRLEKTPAGEVLVTERVLRITQDRLPASEWLSYRTFLDGAAKSAPFVQVISLGPRQGPGHWPPVAGENNPQAADLVREASRAMNAGDVSDAVAKLDAARAINPRQPMLWSGYASVKLRTGKAQEAVESYRRELGEHPAEGSVSRGLVVLLVHEGRTAEAVAVLRAGLVADPQDEESARLLAGLLARTDLHEAEKTLRAGLAASPENPALELALGDVLVRLGKREEGAGLLSALAASSEDAALLNDTAYLLAEAGLQLREAERAARRALEILNAAAARGPGGVGSAADLRRSAQLIACWDTYGWVLYKEASYSEAEPWLRAAWADGLGAAAGAHLARLLQKQGRAAEAGTVLAQAGREGAEGRAAEGKAGRSGMDAERTFAVPRGEQRGTGSAVFELEYSLNAGTQARLVRGDAGLEKLSEALARVNTRTLLPGGSAAHLLRRGEVTCGTGASCTLRLLSPEAAAEP